VAGVAFSFWAAPGCSESFSGAEGDDGVSGDGGATGEAGAGAGGTESGGRGGASGGSGGMPDEPGGADTGGTANGGTATGGSAPGGTGGTTGGTTGGSDAGSGGSGDQGGCGPDVANMICVPGGTFMMGCRHGDPALPDETCDTEEGPDELPYHAVSLGPFLIDRTKVIVGDYERCVADGACSSPATVTRCNYSLAGQENHPVNCVDWSQANQYCTWANKRLPTEAEWEKAARGTDGRTYPWGEPELSCTFAVIYDATPGGCGLGGTAVADSKPDGASPYGVLDMLGNLTEWTNDWYDASYYSSPSANEDPPGPSSGTERSTRGVSWGQGGGNGWAKEQLRIANRASAVPTYNSAFLGFRCAKTP
jgi:formylglycine-generating enzyme required for sulfatase activity